MVQVGAATSKTAAARRKSCTIRHMTVGDGELRAERHGVPGELDGAKRDMIASGLTATSHGSQQVTSTVKGIGFHMGASRA